MCNEPYQSLRASDVTAEDDGDIERRETGHFPRFYISSPETPAPHFRPSHVFEVIGFTRFPSRLPSQVCSVSDVLLLLNVRNV